ncbi:MAG: sugar transferase [Bacteroidia bacterium]
MEQQQRIYTIKYVFADFIAAALAWGLFYSYRKLYIESDKFGYSLAVDFDRKFWFGIIFIPLFWLGFYWIIGTYKNVLRRSRLREIAETLYISIIGVLIIFFGLLLDDTIINYRSYYDTIVTLFSLQFILTATLRFILSTGVAHKIRNRKIGFNTLLIGSNQKALNLFTEFESRSKSYGNRFVGFIHIDDSNGHLFKDKLIHLGELKDARDIIRKYHVEEAIIAVESVEHEKVGRIINELDDTDVRIKILPDIYDILTGTVKMNSIFGALLLEVNPVIMPQLQQNAKRIFDVLVALFFLILLSPVYAIIAIIIKLTSRGPIFFSQERIGLHGNPFMIHKFRSMYKDAENGTPQLSSTSDSRVTPFGRFMRKIRLDEIPQFWNVLIGDMSIVGPRPERQYFIDLIMENAPHYRHLHKVRPGITSWGQVKFGYAENVEQMIERLKYDIIYIENMSIGLDIKILFYTIKTIVQGRGK